MWGVAHLLEFVVWKAPEMVMNALIKPLLGVELFQGLRPLQITEIARRADRIVFKPGDVILQRNAAGDAAVLLVSGDAVRLAGPFDDAPHDEPLPAGSLLGEMAMLIETDHSSTIIARTAVKALRISRSELHAQMAEDQTLADHFVQRIATRLTGIANVLRDIDNRLAAPAASQLPAYRDGAAASNGTNLPALH